MFNFGNIASADDGWSENGERFAGERNTLIAFGEEFAFHYCPPGTFTMGSPEDEERRRDDETQHEVTLTRGFWLMETPVTQEQWRAVMGNSPSKNSGEANLPVENVSWNDFQEFIGKLNDGVFSPNGRVFSLPTEAQWEYACRAGTTGARYDDLDIIAWSDENDLDDKPRPVGLKKPNAWGIYDTLGNVWEGEYPTYDSSSEDSLAADADSSSIQRKIVMNWSLDLEVEDFDAAYADIERIAADNGGYVVSGYTNGDNSGGRRDGFISIRVEADSAHRAVDEICALGEVLYNDFSSQDVTSEYYDLEARLSAYQAQEQRLLELYGQAVSVSEMLEIENQLTRVRSDIESLQGKLKYYDQVTALSLIEIGLSSPAVYTQTVEPKGWQGFVSKLKSGFLTGLNNTLDGLASFLVWLARALPFLVVLALVIIVVVSLFRHARHKGKPRK